jgi:serine/alanine adding enzyme
MSQEILRCRLVPIMFSKMTNFAWSRTEDRSEWDDFVTKNRGSIYHSWAWRLALQSSGLKPLYMACRDNRGNLTAICPFMYVKKRGRLYVLHSLPHGHMAGPLISTETTNVAEVIEPLRRSVKFSIFNPVVAMTLKVHQQPIVTCLDKLGFAREATGGLFILDLLSKTTADIWVQEFGKEERYNVEYFEKGGSSFELASQESDYERFLSILHESQRHQGYDPLPRQFLSSLRSNFGDKFRVALIASRNETVAAVGFFCDTSNSVVHWVYVGYSRVRSSRSFKPPLTVVFAGWNLVNWASKNGFRYFDFGPTDPNPSDPRHQVKKKFGAEWTDRYVFTMPIQSRLALPAYMKSRSIVRSIIGVVPGFRKMTRIAPKHFLVDRHVQKQNGYNTP